MKSVFVDRPVSAIHPHTALWNAETSGRINACSLRRVKFADGTISKIRGIRPARV